MKYAALLLLLGCAVTLPRPAAAFCRTTTCDPSDPKAHCHRDLHSCLIDGAPLYWPSSCLTLSVQADGSPQRHISAEETAAVLQNAIDAWSSVDCGGAAPSLHIKLSEPVSCGEAQYNEQSANANVVIYRDGTWPYPGSADAYGFTHLSFGSESGELWGADIEINSAEAPLSVGDPVDGADLGSIITHELGHVLGLDHTATLGATMFSTYTDGDDSLRTPEADDAAGLCAIYPPDRTSKTDSCEPKGGFSELCAADQPPPEPMPNSAGSSKGCGIAGQERAPTSAALLLSACVVAFQRRRRRA